MPSKEKKPLIRCAALLGFSAILAAGITLFQFGATFAGMDDRSETLFPAVLETKGQERNHAQYAQGQFIVKYKDTLTSPADLIFEQRLQFRDATSDASNRLDHLHSLYYVKSIKPLLRHFLSQISTHLPSDDTLAQRRQLFQNLIEASKSNHIHRTKRAAKGSTIPDLTHTYLIEVPEDRDIPALCAEYSQDPTVEYCQPNYLAKVKFIPNDPYYSSTGSWGQPYDDLWGLKIILSAEAWNLSSGLGTTVAVIDTGIDYNHADIAANVWANSSELLNGVDDDGNGFVDDIRGWDFAYDDNDPKDNYGHGTHVSGTIGAIGHNSLGVIGVAYQSNIMPVQGLDSNGYGTFADLANAIVYAAINGADVINNSWGCYGCSDDILITDAVSVAHGLGSVVVFAAGNEDSNVKNAFPANIPGVLTVAATDPYDSRSAFSNWGYLIDLSAPGGGPDVAPPSYEPDRNILSVRAEGTGDSNLLVGTDYLRQAGTSMAAPHVSGVAALVLALNPSLTREEVMSTIKHTADVPVGVSVHTEDGYSPFYGWGRLNAMNAVASAFSPPPDPPFLKITPEELVFELPQSICPDTSLSLDIFNIGSGILNWTASAPPWLIPNPSAGTAPSTLSIIPDTTESQADILEIQSTEAANSPIDIPVSVNISSSLETIECDVIITQANSNQDWYPLSPLNPNPPGVPDQLGGAIYVWVDTRNGKPDLFMQRIDSSGQATWQVDGLALEIVALGDSATSPAIIGDGIGGAIIAWREGLNSSSISSKDIKAQRVSAAGELLWGNSGVLITGAAEGQINPTLVPDGNGGAVIAWTDYRNAGGSDIYAQRVDADGIPLWAQDGVPVTQAADYQFGQVMAPDGSGGAILAWTDRRTGYFTTYAQRIDGQGIPQWATNGIRIGSEGESDFATIIEDGGGGAIIVWMDRSNQTGLISRFDIFGQRVDASGQVQWGPDGAAILTGLTASGGMFHPDWQPGGTRLISDGNGGIILSWFDDRNGEWDIFAQRVQPDGSSAWSPDGVPVVTAPGTQMMSSIISDQEGGAFFAWHDERAENGGLYLQRISPTGQPLWALDGILVQSSQTLGDQVFLNLVPLSGNRLLLSWDDWRNCSNLCSGTSIDMLGRVMKYHVPLPNQPPTLDPIGPQIVDEGSLLSFTLSGNDPDGDTPTYSVTPLPSGASMDISSGAFSWTPATNQSGAYPVTFTISDGQLTDYEDVMITVVDVGSTLTVTSLGTGNGTVTSDPAGIDCGNDCQEVYANGTIVDLMAVSNPDSTFAGWGGDGDCLDGTVTMDIDNTCSAVFDIVPPPPPPPLELFSLNVTQNGTGTGTITSNPFGINCGGDCFESYENGTVVGLTATPSAGSTFAGWSGDTDCSNGTITMNTSKGCTATFNLQTFGLTVNKAGTGNGTVTSSPSGIDCGTDCAETYTDGMIVTLTATSDSESDFIGWSGDCTGAETCELSMTQSRDVTATFEDKTMGDLDDSSRVDGFDLGRLGLAFGSQAGDLNWNPAADLNNDGIVEESDLTILKANFGKTN